MIFFFEDDDDDKKCKILGIRLTLVLKVCLWRPEVSSSLPLSFLLDKTSLCVTFINK